MIDFHTSFQVQDIWTVLSESKRFKINEHNKGTLLPHFNIEGLKIGQMCIIQILYRSLLHVLRTLSRQR